MRLIGFVLILAALFSLFVFPYPLSIVLSLCASIFFPPTGVVLGILSDALYNPATGTFFPLASVLGVFISLAGFFMQRFIKARIMAS